MDATAHPDEVAPRADVVPADGRGATESDRPAGQDIAELGTLALGGSGGGRLQGAGGIPGAGGQGGGASGPDGNGVFTDTDDTGDSNILDSALDAASAEFFFGTESQPCANLGALACAGPNQQQTLLCSGGTWRRLTTCPEDQRCDRETGLCTVMIPSCQGLAPGAGVCDGLRTLRVCGPDRVTIEVVACPGTCAAGACQPARCGDGQVTGTEECDDGNALPADGCEPDCRRTQILKLVAGRAHTCALLSEGNVRCWGVNTQGQLGLGNTHDLTANKPYKNDLVRLGSPAVALAAGADHTCALMADRSLRCWGTNQHGQLGLGNTSTIGDDELPSAAVASPALGQGVKTVAAGGNVTCAILDDSSLRCWGQNSDGQLGLGHTNNIGDNEAPTAVAAGVSLGGPALLVATGGNHTCATLPGNLGRCWGKNGSAQLGLGIVQNIGDDELPTDVAPITFFEPVTSLAVGSSRTCALLTGPSEYCWGNNDDGGLGWGFVGTDPLVKATDWGVFGWIHPVVEISAGSLHQCVAISDHQLRCWGINAKAQLGLPSTQTLGNRDSVVVVPPIDLGVGADGFASYAKTIASGVAHTCAILGDGNVRCWGANESGQLGLGFVSVPPVDYVGGTTDSVPGKLPLVIVTTPP